MKKTLFVILLMILQAISTAAGERQSLADAARKEAERRLKVDQQGVPVRRIESADLTRVASAGAISVSSPELHASLSNAREPRAEPRASLRSFQARLQKLDRDIAQAEERLKLLRARADAERWAPTKSAKGSRGSGSSPVQDQLRWQILETEGKLADLRRDRSDTFQAGRKAGYLPGELENRGVMR